MRRILVPLDGTDLAAAILPDARRLAGPAGELVLIQDIGADHAMGRGKSPGGVATQDYLKTLAEKLRREGARVRVHSLVVGDAAVAIDEAVDMFQINMIALATHGRSPSERLWWGSVAWRAALRSPVPVLLRHMGGPDEGGVTAPERRRIMVPLDGSELAAQALPLARDLAGEWQAELWLIRVVAPESMPADADRGTKDFEETVGVQMAWGYLNGLTSGAPADEHAAVPTGPTIPTLVAATRELGITDIVMTSHGRTGLSRVLVGSIADGLIHQLYCPILVIPALVALTQPSVVERRS